VGVLDICGGCQTERGAGCASVALQSLCVCVWWWW
jgi:hypothetical protein